MDCNSLAAAILNVWFLRAPPPYARSSFQLLLDA